MLISFKSSYMPRRKHRRSQSASSFAIVLVAFYCGGALAAESTIPYFYCDGSTSATLELANLSTKEQRVTPIVMIEGKFEHQLEPAVVGGLETVQVPLDGVLLGKHNAGEKITFNGRWGDGSRSNSLWGSVRLVTDGPSTVGSWVLSTDSEESLSIAGVEQRHSSASKQLQSLWWRPTDATEVYFVLTNVGKVATSIMVEVMYNGWDGNANPNVIELASGQSQLIDLNGLSNSSGYSSGAVRFTSNDAAILGTTIAVDEEHGYTLPLLMRAENDWADSRQARLDTVSMPIGPVDADSGFPAGTHFEPYIILANVTDKSIAVTPTIWLTDGRSLSLNEINVNSGATEELNIFEATADIMNWPANAKIAMTLRHDGRPSDLHADGIVVSAGVQPYWFSAYAPFFDGQAQDTFEMSPSFNLTGERQSAIAVRNTTETEQSYRYVINYSDENGESRSYISSDIKVTPNGQSMADIRKLRDNQIPDVNGKTLPLTIEFGHYVMFKHGDPQGLIYGNPNWDPLNGTCDGCTPEPEIHCDPIIEDSNRIRCEEEF